MSQRSAFVFRQHRQETALREKVLAIGWHKLRQLTASSDWDSVKADLAREYPDLYARSPHALGNAAGSVWRFLREMIGLWSRRRVDSSSRKSPARSRSMLTGQTISSTWLGTDPPSG